MIHSCRTRADFQRLRSDGVRRSGRRLWIRHVDDISCTPPRVAFALGRSSGSAPVRNRLRRQVRALMRDGSVEVRPGLYLIGVRGRIVTSTATELRAELEVLLP